MFQSGSRAYAPLSLSSKLGRIPWSLIVVTLAIGSIGVVSLYSVAGGAFAPWADRHALRLAIGVIIVVALALVPLRFWIAAANPIFISAFALVALVPIFGTTTMGAKRWLSAGPLSLQPSEFLKIALVLVSARYYQFIAFEKRSRPLYVALPMLVIGAATTLIARQPDLGSAALVALIGLTVMFLAGVHAAYFIACGAIVIGLGQYIWPRLHDYQKSRVMTFLNPERDPLGAGYHISQSKIALGSGGVNGKGLINGSQSQLNFLPEKHTDFIFTMFAEEMGYVGSMALLGLYVLLLAILAVMASRVNCRFSRLLIAGVAAILAVHVTVNVGMVIGLIPVVGVPLPLVSYGGTSMLTLMFGLGLAASAYVHRGDTIRRDELGVFV
ncbi:MAG: rod shape-determining protein RodA [Hyphomicrobiaceae bacterium]|nr:rod shape-determining protein RodA [Hyphomicrobiaceae bacterium]